MKYQLKLFTLLLICVSVSCNTPSGSNQRLGLNDDYSARIDSLIQTTSPRSFNGVILITQNGETKYSKEYGYSNIEKQTPISLNDNFRIQSNSKQITAVVILKEVEKGNIELHAPIRTYLPHLASTWADTVTVHQLLNMSSGIVRVDKPLAFTPGTDYRYSNVAYGLLGDIVEIITGESYITVANRLLKSVGMTNSYCYELGKENKGLIDAYRVDGSNFNWVDFGALGITEEGWKSFIPAGGIISNAKDLNLWDQKLHNGELLNDDTYQLMTSYTTLGQHDAFGDQRIGYGYGVRIHDKGPIKHIGHAGRGIGFASIKFYIPEKDVDVIVLENVYNEDTSIIYHFEKEIRKIVLNSSLVKKR